MSAVATPLKVVIAADTAMSRDVVRFFLQASGDIEVIGQAASAGNASWMAKKYAADAVVVHAGIAFDATQDAVRQVRSAAPAARIVVVTPEGGGVPLPMSSRGADSYLEEGVGLAELAFVLVSLCRSPDIAIDVQPAFDRGVRPDPVVVLPQPEPELVFAGASSAVVQIPSGAGPMAPAAGDPAGPATSMSWRGRGGFVPLLAAAAAFVMVVGLTMYRSQLEAFLAPRGTAYFAGVHTGPTSAVLLLASERRLGDLVHSLHGARIMNAPAIARDLVERRSQIVEAGGDVSALDREIEMTLRPIIATVPPGIAVAVLTVLAPVAGWASADLDSLLLGGASPSPGNQGSQEPAPSGTPAAGSTGPDQGLPSPSDSGLMPGAEAAGGTGGSDESGGSTHEGDHGSSEENGGHDGTGGDTGGGNGGASGNGDGDPSGDGDDGGGDGSGGDGDGQGEGDQGGDGDHGGEGAGGGDDQGEESPGEEGDQGSVDGAGQGTEDCDHPGNGGGHGYGHCEGQGGGNEERGEGEDASPGGGNQGQALLIGPVLLLGRRRRRC